MARIIHMCLDIRGGIMNAKLLRGNISVDGKTLRTEKEVKNFLQSQLDMGRILTQACNADDNR